MTDILDVWQRIPQQPQRHCATQTQVQALARISRRLGLSRVANRIIHDFPESGAPDLAPDLATVVDPAVVAGLPELPQCQIAPNEEYRVAILVANRFGLYDAADLYRRHAA